MASKFKVLVLNGPNLNLLGRRENEHYGSETLDEVVDSLKQEVGKYDGELIAFQTNHEGEMLDFISAHDADYIIINPGAWTHTSIALRDALLAVGAKFIEVHISNIYKRETFRQHSFISDIAQGTISGLGTQGYRLALQALIKNNILKG